MMTHSNTPTRDHIIEWYMDDLLSKDREPHSIFKFCKEHQFSETIFYQYFADFEQLTEVIFSLFAEKTIELLEKEASYQSGDTRHKLLSFYFTFFENLSVNRSFVLLKLKQNSNKLEVLKSLRLLRKTYIDFVKSLGIKTPDLKQEKLQKLQEKGLAEGAWMQLVFTLQFWLNDRSNNFEKTDIFIEKSVKAAFDISDFTPLNSLFDFAKFVYQEHLKP